MFRRRTKTVEPTSLKVSDDSKVDPGSAKCTASDGSVQQNEIDYSDLGPELAADRAATRTDDKTAAIHAGPIANNEASAAASGEAPARQVTAAEVHFAVSFTRILSVLMKSDPYRKVALGHIEQFIAPPMLSGQFAIMDARINGQIVPVAVAFWAHVSAEVDRRLSDASVPAILQPPEWRSGDILWLVDIVGQPQAVGQLMQQLKAKAFAGREVKMRRKDADGHFVVSDLHAKENGR